MSNTLTNKQKFNKRLESLKTERSHYMDYWGELSDYHMAQRGRFLGKGERKAPKRNTKQYNNKSRTSARTLAAGMMAGITSPARPWFKLQSSDPNLNEFTAVKEWLNLVQKLMYRVYSASNFYNTLHSTYVELGIFGTPAMGIFEDYDNVIRCKSFTTGSFMLGLNGKDKVDTFYREYERSVGQLVKAFGIDNVSHSVKRAWETGSIENMIPCVHVIEPNDDRDNMSPFAKDMPFRSVYYEKNNDIQDNYLQETGFKTFPIMAPRWTVIGEDVYSSDCPGMTALGDTKALQLGEQRKYQALDKIGNPPLQGSAQVSNKTGNKAPAPGSITLLGANDNGLESVYKQFRPDIKAIMEIQYETEQRISTAFYEDLFLAMINGGRNRKQPITATEVAERHEEKLLMLGPVLERLHSEMLDPIIDRTFNIIMEAGILPPAPEELQGSELSVEYISVLAQAQRMVGISALESTVNFAASVTQIWPEARHKIDILQTIDEYADNMGVPPKTIRSDEDTEALINQENAAAQQQEEQEQAALAAQSAKTASEANLDGNSALSAALSEAGL